MSLHMKSAARAPLLLCDGWANCRTDVRFGVQAVWKRARAKCAHNCFLNCLLPTEAGSAIGFYIDEIEMEILRAS
jgi:hypothetical protein